MKSRKPFAAVLAACTVLGLTAAAGAAITEVGNSEYFTYRYEFDDGKKPEEADIDGNSTFDFTLFGGYGTSTVSGGILTMETTSKPGDHSYLSSAANQIWDVAAPTLATGYTIETRVKIATDPALPYPLSILASPGGTGAHAYLRVDEAGQWWRSTPLGGTLSNDDDFHTFRIAQQPGSATYSVWRDGVLLSGTLSSGYTNSAFDRLVFGDTSSSHAGKVEIDYFRFTNGAFAPIVPEPSSLVVWALAVAMLLWCGRRGRK